MEETPVVFYRISEGDILGVFPFSPAIGATHVPMDCFDLRDGWSSCDPGYLRGRKLASPEEYRNTLRTLEETFDLQVEPLPRMPRNAGAVRFKAWQSLGVLLSI